MEHKDWMRHRRVQEIGLEVQMELLHAREKFPPMQSAHEGYAILLEEVDELWEEVKGNKGDPSLYRQSMRKEAVQVAAMALAFILEVCEPIDYST